MNMKVINFPDPETNPNHGSWTWDGEKWVSNGSSGGGSSGGGIGEAPTDGTQYGRYNAGWTPIVAGGAGNDPRIADQDITKWDASFNWGPHADAGYLTSFTESDPTVPSHVKSITTADIDNWNAGTGGGDLPEMTSDATKNTLVLRDENANAKFNLITSKNFTMNQPTISSNTADTWFLSGGEQSTHGVKKNDAAGMRSSLNVYSKTEIDAMTIGGGGDGAVTSVNEQTGAVVLTAADVGAQVTGDYAASSHTHSEYQAKGDYAASGHVHSEYQVKGDYAASGHTHDYADSDHTHSEYQAKGDYASSSHNHSGVYEPVIGAKKTAFNVNFGTASGDAARGNHTHNYASSSHNHSGVYEPVITTKKSAFNVNFGTGNGDAARGNHTHNYAAASHTHDYAASNHNHSGVYATASHTHSGYAASNHTHSGYLSSTGLTNSNGTLYGTDFVASSDERLKENVTTVPIGLVDSIKGKEWEWKESGEKGSGVIAQELEQVLPHLVRTDDEGMKSVAYNGLIAYLIEEIKDCRERISVLEAK